MNANELADELDYCYGKEYPCPVSKEASTMLRQQQERIKQLEETQEYLYKTHDADKAQIEALKRPNNVVGVPADKLAEMQAEIEALNKVIALITEQHDRLSKMLETSLTLNKELNTQLAGWDIEASLKKDYK